MLRSIVRDGQRLAVAVTGGAYPALDVPREIAAADAWLVANPKNKKSDGARFLNGWLARAQERAPRVDGRHATPVAAPRPPSARRLGPVAPSTFGARDYDAEREALIREAEGST